MTEFEEFLEYHRASIGRDPRGWFKWVVFAYRWQYKRWFLELLNLLGEVQMARGKSQGSKQSGSKQLGSVWFVNVAVSVADAGKIDDFFPSVEAVYDAMIEVMTDGYRVAFNYDVARDAVVCSLTCRNEGLANHNGVLNAFAGDWFRALQVVLYKHYVILNETWSNEGGAAARPEFG